METTRSYTALWGSHVAVLTGFAVSQPLFAVLGKEPQFFIAHHTGVGGLVLFTVAVILAPALVFWGLSGLAALGGDVPRALGRGVAVALLVGLTVLPLLHRGGLTHDAAALAVAMTIGIAGAFAYHRLAAVRSFVTVLTPSVLIFPLLFLFASPSADLLRPAAVDTKASEVDATTPIVLIVFDEFPTSSLLDENESIATERYPAFAELARGSTWYRRATTVAPFTDQAVPAIVTGKLPEIGATSSAQDHPQSLFTWLAGSYELHVRETMTALCPPELISDAVERPDSQQAFRSLVRDTAVVYRHVVLPPDLAGLGDVTSHWKDFGGRRERQGPPTATRSDAPGQIVTRFLETIRPNASATLHFLHLVVPHQPWMFLPSGREYGPVGNVMAHNGRDGGTWRREKDVVDRMYQRHLLQVGYADHLLGRLLVRLRETGVYDRALIVVTADHGITFVPGTVFRGVTPDVAQDVLSIPLFVKLPEQKRGEVSDLPAELIDILPTIAKEIGAELPWTVEGHPLDDPAIAERHEKTVRVAIMDMPAQHFTMTYDDLAGRTTLDRKLALFGRSHDDLYAMGPHPDLLGRRPDAFIDGAAVDAAYSVPLGGSKGGRDSIELADTATYEDVDPAGRFLPSHITGRWFSDDASDNGDRPAIAVALNGRIRATTKVFKDARGQPRFAAMVPEDAFRAGRNSVEIFAVDGGRLIPAPRRDSVDRSLILVDRADGSPELRRTDGSVLRLATDDLAGQAVTPGIGAIFGWAADRRDVSATVDVVGFHAGREVFHHPADSEILPFLVVDPDLELESSGFRAVVPFALLPEGTSVQDLRLFVVHGDDATEVPIVYHGMAEAMKPKKSRD